MSSERLEIQRTEVALQTGYRDAAAQYRRDDDIEVHSSNHEFISGVLKGICGSFGRPISVLDVGCGTGRYFHCLTNVERLVGMDISNEMLIAAEDPVNSSEISIHTTELIQGNVYFSSFEPQSFDFIFSLGMFGYGCPVTTELCDRFYSWLVPGGKLYFNVISITNLPWLQRLKREAGKFVHPYIAACIHGTDVSQEEIPSFALSQSQLENILGASRFRQFNVTARRCESPLWQGNLLECHAESTAESEQSSVTSTNAAATSKAGYSSAGY
jgi:ubiquinone/menaquinone biosynthesis C-methylase UbiE